MVEDIDSNQKKKKCIRGYGVAKNIQGKTRHISLMHDEQEKCHRRNLS